MPEIPQLTFPLSITGGRVREVEQGSAEDLAGRVELICVTPLGWFEGRPELGLADQAFLEGGPDLTEIERQLTEHVPDLEVTEDLSALERGLARIGVRVTT